MDTKLKSFQIQYCVLKVVMSITVKFIFQIRRRVKTLTNSKIDTSFRLRIRGLDSHLPYNAGTCTCTLNGYAD